MARTWLVGAIGLIAGVRATLARPTAAAKDAPAERGFARVLFNKYWVDELYGLAITRRTMDAARAVYAFDAKVVDGIVNGFAWLSRQFSVVVGGFDKYFVDGLVNTVAAFIVRLMSPLFRAAQTGFTQNYALVMVVGLMIAVVVFFASDVARAITSAVRRIFATVM